MVDAYFPGLEATDLEPNYMLDADTWEKLQCSDFLDASRTHVLGRTMWLPNTNLVPERFRRRWGSYCLLRRNTVKS